MANTSRVFHTVVIGNCTFTGSMSADGPYLSCHNGTVCEHGVALGVSKITYLDEDSDRSFGDRKMMKAGWYVVKYSDERRIGLHSLDDQQIRELANEFGLRLECPGQIHSPFDPSELFFKSPAFKSLCRWVKDHPRLAKQMSVYDHYMGGWYEEANPICKSCGMPIEKDEFHPYAACLMFKGCLDAEVVRANLDAVIAHGVQIEVERREEDSQVYASLAIEGVCPASILDGVEQMRGKTAAENQIGSAMALTSSPT